MLNNSDLQGPASVELVLDLNIRKCWVAPGGGITVGIGPQAK